MQASTGPCELGLIQPGTVWKLKKAPYGLRTSPRAWEEERDRKLSSLTWDSPAGKVGLKPVNLRGSLFRCAEPLPTLVVPAAEHYVEQLWATLDKTLLHSKCGIGSDTPVGKGRNS